MGAIAQKIHIPTLSLFEDVDIISAAEADITRGKKLASKFGINNVFIDYNEMYENVNLDAVFICLPNFLHYDAVKKALNNDIHVFCEKPMGTSVNKAHELVKLAKNKNLVLATGYNRRLEKNYQDMYKLVKSLRLGKLIQANVILVNPGPYGGWIPSSDWFFKEKYGVLYDSGPHVIDLLLYLLSENIIEVSATGTGTLHGIDIFDNIVGSFKSENGIIGSFNMGWQIGANYDSVQLHGDGASVIGNSTEIEIRHRSYGPLERISDYLNNTKKIIKTYTGSRKDTHSTYYLEDRSFIDSIINKSNPLVSGEDGLRVLEVLDAIKESLDNKKTIKVHNKLSD